MTLEISLALLAFSAPITAGIIVFRPHKTGDGKYVSTREYDAFRIGLGDRLNSFEAMVISLNDFVRSRL